VNPQLVLALIAKFTSLSKETAEKLSKELDLAIQPTNYKDAEQLVEKIVASLRK
jgi:hypothetical protein